MIRRARPVAIYATLAAAAASGACASAAPREMAGERRQTASNSTTTPQQQPPVSSTVTAPTRTASTVSVTLEDYNVTVAPTTTVRGSVSLRALNHDRAPHDLALYATQRPLDDLPTTGVRVDEQSTDLRFLGRIPTLSTHETGEVTVDIAPGTYALVCTVPHHYVRDRMATTLVVT